MNNTNIKFVLISYLIATNGVLASMIKAIPKKKSPTPGFRKNINNGNSTKTKIKW